MNRRDFLKASVLAAAGIGTTVAFSTLGSNGADAAEITKSGKALQAKQWGMVIDVSKFHGPEDFKKVAEACHLYHNVPDTKSPKDEVKWIWQESFEHAFEELENPYLSEHMKEQNFPVLCNHCENPACVRVCPTKSTFKRRDGIVAMDYHRCIGCRFCMAGCPFGARSFNFKDPRPFIDNLNYDYPTRTIGVVEKCTFCVERLDQGLKPLCVEASNGAILFGDLGDPNSEVRKVLAENFAIRRRVELGTGPCVYYVIRGGGEHA